MISEITRLRRKKIPFSILFILLSLNVIGQEEYGLYKSTTRISYVDSLFQSNFDKMRSVVDLKYYQEDDYLDRNFIYLVSFLTAINCHTIDFTGFCRFTEIELDQWEKWYIEKRDILQQDDIKKALEVIKKPIREGKMISLDSIANYVNTNNAFLDSLYSKYNDNCIMEEAVLE